MPKVNVGVRFRPLSAKESGHLGYGICVNKIDLESFAIKDEKDAEIRYCFDRVFYDDSTQADVYDFLAAPIVEDAFSGINGTIIMYGQTGAGKTYSMEGPSFVGSDDHEKGILQRVLDELFERVESVDKEAKYTVKISMVEIYMEKVRDLLDLAKDCLQIKESKLKGIYIDGATEIFVQTSAEALQCLSTGISNRAVGETQMNASSSRSHCMYLFSVQDECTRDGQVKSGKLILVDLAGSEKVDKTKAEGKVLDEAKTINKSLSALGNVLKALTREKVNHIPYRDSKLTRLLQDALGGNSRTSLLCCCSPSSINQSESLSTVRFGARAKLIKLPVMVDIHNPQAPAGQVSGGTGSESRSEVQQFMFGKSKENTAERALVRLKGRLNIEDLKLLEELLVQEGIVYDPCSVLFCETEIEDFNTRAMEMLQKELQSVYSKACELESENKLLKAKIEALENPGKRQLKVPFIGGIHWLWDAMRLVKI